MTEPYRNSTFGPGRWSFKRKAAVIQAIASGRYTRADACQVFALTPEELAHWERLYSADGSKALRATRLQIYRSR